MTLLFVVQNTQATSSNVPKRTWTVSSIGSLSKIPAPKTGDWVRYFGGWKGFTKAIHRSIGRNLGGGVLKFSEKV